MSDISRKALHKKVFERMEAEVPQSRAHLGGYHTGKRDAYLNVITDLRDIPSTESDGEELKKQEKSLLEVLVKLLQWNNGERIITQGQHDNTKAPYQRNFFKGALNVHAKYNAHIRQLIALHAQPTDTGE
jgi:hypothetical protein